MNQVESPDTIDVDLRDPLTAAVLAWLIPGAGHFYQRRMAKAAIFFVCILGTYFYGLYLGDGRVVYASLRPGDRRLPFLCQVGVGLPALPAVVQAYRARSGRPHLWNGFMAPPRLPGTRGPLDKGELAEWQKKSNRFFELGTVYTMIAGLLNVLAIYDAWGGPLLIVPPGRDDKSDGKSKSDKEKPPDDDSS